MEREALKLALEALESDYTFEWPAMHRPERVEKKRFQAITAIKAALAQPAQEPVAWAVVGDGKFGKYEIGRETLTDIDSANYWISYWISRGYKLVSIYTTPPQRLWVGLTDEEIRDCLGPEAVRIPLGWSRLTRAIEQALKEKNNG